MASQQANRLGKTLRLALFVCILLLGCVASASSFRNIFSPARWGRSLLPHKIFISSRGGGDKQTQASSSSGSSSETATSAADEEESESEYETEEESMWIGDGKEEKTQHQVNANDWFEENHDANTEIKDDEEDLGVTDLDEDETVDASGDDAQEEEEEFFDAQEELEAEEEKYENAGDLVETEIEVEVEVTTNAEEEDYVISESIVEDSASETGNVDEFEVNEVVANYPEGSVEIGEAVVVDEIEPSIDDEGSSPTDVYPEEPGARPKSFVEEEGDQFEDLESAGAAEDLVSEQEPVFVSDVSMPMGSNDGGIEMELAQHQQQFNTDDDSTAFVDRMELADGEDEGETTAGGYAIEEAIPAHAPTGAAPTAHSTSMEEDLPVENPVEEELETIVEVTETSVEVPAAVKANPDDKLDDDTIRALRYELLYSAHEVKNIKTEIAAVVVEKKLKRPKEGMPLNWYRSGKGPDKLAKVKKYAKPTLMAAFAGYVVLQNGGILPRRRSSKKKEEVTGDNTVALNATEAILEDALLEEAILEDALLEGETIAEEQSEQVQAENWFEQLITTFGNRLNELLSLPASILKRFRGDR